MGKTLIKYLFFLGTVLITSVLSLYANSEINGFGEDFLERIEANINHAPNNFSQQEHRSKLVCEITESQKTEKDESFSEDDYLSSYASSNNVFNVHLSNSLSFHLVGVLRCYKNYFDKSATKLHVRLQVFII